MIVAKIIAERAVAKIIAERAVAKIIASGRLILERRPTPPTFRALLHTPSPKRLAL